MAQPSQQPESSQQQPAFGVISNMDATPKHPWKRYIARMIDNFLLMLVNLPVFVAVALVAGLLSDPGKMEGAAGNYLITVALGALAAVEMVALETCLLATWGTTPGKRIFGLHVRNANGEKLSYRDAFKRSGILQGMFLIPALIPFGSILNIALLIFQRRQLLKTGYTTWDKLIQGQVGPV